jgi:thiol-disulfide isomerase/thioredoxin
MSMIKFSLLFFLAVFTCATAATAEPLSLSDVDGGKHTLLAGDKKPMVLVFVSPYCPTSNAFTPEINRIAADYDGRVAFYLVEADADITGADARKHVETMEIKAPVLLDPAQRLAKLTKAKTTPEAVVLDTNGYTLYQGRINDLYATQTKKLKEPKTHDLRVALDAILAGKPVANPATKAIGCSISGTQ